MTNFSSFYKKPTPHSREHQQTSIRSFNRKHLNQVPNSKSQQKEDPLIDRIFKYDKRGKWLISKLDAARILKTYGIKHVPEKSYKKAINRTGIYINYNQLKDQYHLIKL
jgi:hypothetical protein